MRRFTDRLLSLADEDFKDFNMKLIPNENKNFAIGVRTPNVRKLAKELSKDSDVYDFLNELPHKYHEENCLHGYIIENIAKDYDTAVEMTEKFLPYITNWAVCDTFSPKAFRKNLDALYDKTLEWMKSDHVYTVRYGLVTQLKFFLDDNFKSDTLKIIAEIKSDEYYINMAIAWYYSFALIKQYEKTVPMFEKPVLDKWVHNKSLQKALESYRIDKETKDYLRSLKIK